MRLALLLGATTLSASVALAASAAGARCGTKTIYGKTLSIRVVGGSLERDSFFQIDSEYLSLTFGSDGVFESAGIYQG